MPQKRTMHNSSLRLTLVSLGILLATLGIIYGSYLPMAKSQRYIAAIRQLPNVRSLAEFTKVEDGAFNFYSPIGDEEVEKFAAYDVLNIVQQQGQPDAVFHALVKYIEPKLRNNNVRHLLVLAQMYQTLWHEYGKAEDFNAAESYYRKALEIGPKLPPLLYGLANLYMEKGDMANANAIGDRILALWPDAAKKTAGAPSAEEQAPVTATAAKK
jgi:tetratricopeptide (TPR) repeat protein